MADAPVYAVADGMGGHDAGDVASAVAIGSLQRFSGAAAVAPQSVLTALQEANRDIVGRATAAASTNGMGTTIVGLVLSRHDAADSLLVFNVGDSRAYRLRGGEFVQLSDDHSLVAELVLTGELTPAAARTDPRRNVVTRALGMAEVVEIDNWLIEPKAGDRYLVCSDGLTTELTDPEIGSALMAVGDADAAAEELVRLALEAGGRDNISVVVIDIDEVGYSDTAADEDTNPRPVPVLDSVAAGSDATTAGPDPR